MGLPQNLWVVKTKNSPRSHIGAEYLDGWRRDAEYPLGSLFDGPDDLKYGVVIVEPYRIEYCAPASLKPEIWSA